jgi:hypothetical protein
MGEHPDRLENGHEVHWPTAPDRDGPPFEARIPSEAFLSEVKERQRNLASLRSLREQHQNRRAKG